MVIYTFIIYMCGQRCSAQWAVRLTPGVGLRQTHFASETYTTLLVSGQTQVLPSATAASQSRVCVFLRSRQGKE